MLFSKNKKNKKRLGKYLMKRIIGKGASGEVWLAIDTEKRINKAIKVIKKGDVSMLSRVDTEIKVIK